MEWLREEVYRLKDENKVLSEENIKLKEKVAELEKYGKLLYQENKRYQRLFGERVQLAEDNMRRRNEECWEK